MSKLAAGVLKFQREAYHARRDLFRDLAEGQSPEALFITCSDSRIDPGLLTQSEPGELFICRNAGNIVPPHTNHTGAMTASIEFAVGALEVPHIIVCGHTGCGAMKAALKPEGLEGFPHVLDWVKHARAATLVVEETGGHLSHDEKLERLVRENVRLQMKHLETHPYVAARLASGRVRVHGWVYDIGSGEVEVWDDAARAFLPLSAEEDGAPPNGHAAEARASRS